MPRHSTSIPVKRFSAELDSGIVIEKIFPKNSGQSDGKTTNDHERTGQRHRHDRHSFYLLEKGTITIEIDFKKYNVKSPSVIYMHPSQVHRVLHFKKVAVTSLAISNANIKPKYLELLDEIAPASPLPLNKDTYSIISETVSLCLRHAKWRQNKLHLSILNDSCNACIGLVASQYIEIRKDVHTKSRFEIVTRRFIKLLEGNYITLRRPAQYAGQLHISTAYLNECVKKVTGFSVSYHIQQRIILEAKRLLYHSDKSVKEIAFELGYDNYPYFSRLFIKVSGMNPLAFRNKNRY